MAVTPISTDAGRRPMMRRPVSLMRRATVTQSARTAVVVGLVELDAERLQRHVVEQHARCSIAPSLRTS